MMTTMITEEERKQNQEKITDEKRKYKTEVEDIKAKENRRKANMDETE